MLNPENKLLEKGFAVIESVYHDTEVDKIVRAVSSTDTSKDTFRKSKDLFTIRQCLKEIPALLDLLLTDKLRQLIQMISAEIPFIIKSIYFDKPASSNWYVAYHQDLTISVNSKSDIEGFGPWTVKQNQFAVQPPLAILENVFTLRIHLDDTDENNGASNTCITPKRYIPPRNH